LIKYKKKKLFISFEGPEASGKSSQLKLLQKYLIKKNIPHLSTREPGGTENAEVLRKIILDKKKQISVIEEILLLMSSRINHINNVILPALNKGKIVITDRFADSTFVYQGFVNKFGMNKTILLHKQLLNNFLPTRTFLFILSPEEINKRLKNRKVSNKYDKFDINFHSKVLIGYKKLAKNNKRFVLLNANEEIMKIHNKIVKSLRL